ncbi:MAG: arylamine N-acetyltransferase [Spirochaetes bacterium]|nr:arylamine N-acetyltransferase [Spirochaetota bacterium]
MFDPDSDPEASIARYFERIDYRGPLEATAQVLADLQDCHLHRVPYENLDILRGREISLAIPDLFDKIVSRRRGGYCFELNALFRWLLERLGFPVVSHFARFWRDEPVLPPKRRHHVLAVAAEGERFLVDVGVGGIVPRRPIPLVEGVERPQGDECYRLDREGEFGWFLMERKKGAWCRLYSFTEELQYPRDFVMANYWCQHAPDSPFRRGAILGMRTREGRRSVAGQEVRLFRPEGVEVLAPEGAAEMDALLEKYFGILPQ